MNMSDVFGGMFGSRTGPTDEGSGGEPSQNVAVLDATTVTRVWMKRTGRLVLSLALRATRVRSTGECLLLSFSGAFFRASLQLWFLLFSYL